MEERGVVRLACERVGGGKVKVSARFSGEAVHLDVLDLASAAARQRFVKALCEKLPAADPAALDSELLRLADVAPASAGPADEAAELDVTRIVRPEQFYTREVSGLALPSVCLSGGRPAARWALYLRWADGRRERRDLSGALDLPGGGRLWLHPLPAEPSVATPPGWSAAARREWLAGAPAPDPAELFRQLCEQIAFFLDFPPDAAAGTTATIALWITLTYCFQAWPAIPYLFVGGPVGSGKSTLFAILNRLVYRPLTSSNLTGPALFRTLHDRGGVLLYDEAERLRQSTPDQQETLSVLLAGYKRGGQATRLEPVGDSFRPVAFDVFGPKALACVAGLPPALASRSIHVMMFRAGPDSPKPRRRVDADPDGWQWLRDRLHALALENGAAWLDLAERPEVCPAGIDGRNHELWQPLLALAAWVEKHGAGGLLELMQRHALAACEAAREDAVPDADETLLEILVELVKAGSAPTPGELLNKARDRDGAAFEKWTARTVSNRLKTYGLRTRKVDRRREFRDVTLADLARVQRHYNLDLGVVDTHPRVASLASRCVPDGAQVDPGGP